MLQPYSKMDSIVFPLPLMNRHTIPNNDEGKTDFLQMFANLFKKTTTGILHLHKYSDPLLSTLLKHLWQ